jgi:hypothetical protein
MAGGTFESDTGGTFQTATAGTFESDTGGTFESDMGGTFTPLLSIHDGIEIAQTNFKYHFKYPI